MTENNSNSNDDDDDVIYNDDDRISSIQERSDNDKAKSLVKEEPLTTPNMVARSRVITDFESVDDDDLLSNLKQMSVDILNHFTTQRSYIAQKVDIVSSIPNILRIKFCDQGFLCTRSLSHALLYNFDDSKIYPIVIPLLAARLSSDHVHGFAYITTSRNIKYTSDVIIRQLGHRQNYVDVNYYNGLNLISFFIDTKSNRFYYKITEIPQLDNPYSKDVHYNRQSFLSTTLSNIGDLLPQGGHKQNIFLTRTILQATGVSGRVSLEISPTNPDHYSSFGFNNTNSYSYIEALSSNLYKDNDKSDFKARKLMRQLSLENLDILTVYINPAYISLEPPRVMDNDTINRFAEGKKTLLKIVGKSNVNRYVLMSSKGLNK